MNYVFRGLMALAALCLASCSGEMGIQKVELSETAALIQGGVAEHRSILPGERAPEISIEISAEFPLDGLSDEAQMRISSAIAQVVFGEDYMAMEAEAAGLAYIDDLVAEYRAENLPLSEIEGLSAASLNWGDYTDGAFISEGAMVKLGSREVISYLACKQTYRGGAHGMSFETGLNFDKKTGETLTEELIFQDGYEAELSALLTRYLPEALEDSSYVEGLFVSEIEPNGNFSVTVQGLTYIFNPYEIAPYAMGTIRVSLPWTELEGLLRR